MEIFFKYGKSFKNMENLFFVFELVLLIFKTLLLLLLLLGSGARESATVR